MELLYIIVLTTALVTGVNLCEYLIGLWRATKRTDKPDD